MANTPPPVIDPAVDSAAIVMVYVSSVNLVIAYPVANSKFAAVKPSKPKQFLNLTVSDVDLP